MYFIRSVFVHNLLFSLLMFVIHFNAYSFVLLSPGSAEADAR